MCSFSIFTGGSGIVVIVIGLAVVVVGGGGGGGGSDCSSGSFIAIVVGVAVNGSRIVFVNVGGVKCRCAVNGIVSVVTVVFDGVGGGIILIVVGFVALVVGGC